MQRKIRAAGALCAALALAAAAACTDDSGGGDGSGPEGAGEVFEEDRLLDMVNESSRLLYDLESAEFRIIQNCLERQDFTVHDQMWFTPTEPAGAGGPVRRRRLGRLAPGTGRGRRVRSRHLGDH